jgi:hypothetical protein
VGFVSSGLVDPYEQPDIVIEPARCRVQEGDLDGAVQEVEIRDGTEPMAAEPAAAAAHSSARTPEAVAAAGGSSSEGWDVAMVAAEAATARDADEVLLMPQGRCSLS